MLTQCATALCLAAGDEGAAVHPPGQRAGSHRRPAAPAEAAHRDQGTRLLLLLLLLLLIGSFSDRNRSRVTARSAI